MKKILFCFIVFFICISPIAISPVYAALGDATITDNGFTITTKASFAGGITSLKDQNFEYLFQQIYQGAFIQYAWQNANRGECDNPTEQGARNEIGKTTSQLLNFTSTSTSITKTVLPAYWLRPGETSIYCNFDSQDHNGTAFNTTLISNSSLQTTFTLDPENLPHALGLTGTITFGTTDTAPGLPFVMFGRPALFFSTSFTKAYRYNYGNDVLLTSSSGNFYNTTLPPVLATADDTHAVGVYSDGVPRTLLSTLPQSSGGIIGYTLNHLASPPDVWYLDTRLPYIPPGNASVITPGMKLSTRAYVIFGTLSEVTAQLHTLYLAHPPIADDCLGIAWESKYAAADCPTTSPSPSSTPTHLPTSTPTPTHASSPSPTQTPTPTSIPVKPGDVNGDGKVDIFDYNILIGDLGKTGSPGFSRADINRDGKVDIFDYNVVIGNFGK